MFISFFVSLWNVLSPSFFSSAEMCCLFLFPWENPRTLPVSIPMCYGQWQFLVLQYWKLPPSTVLVLAAAYTPVTIIIWHTEAHHSASLHTACSIIFYIPLHYMIYMLYSYALLSIPCALSWIRCALRCMLYKCWLHALQSTVHCPPLATGGVTVAKVAANTNVMHIRMHVTQNCS